MYLCIKYVFGAHGGQKRVLDPLKLELQMILSHLWVLGIEPGSCGRAASDLHVSSLNIIASSGCTFFPHTTFFFLKFYVRILASILMSSVGAIL